MFAPAQLPQCPGLKPDVTPLATPALQPLTSDHHLMAPLNPENSRTGTSHRVTQSVAEPLRQPGHPSALQWPLYSGPAWAASALLLLRGFSPMQIHAGVFIAPLSRRSLFWADAQAPEQHRLF